MTAAYMIYDKYAYALGEGVRELSRGNRIHIDAARLALRLALDELAESATATIDQGQPAIVPNALVEEVRSLETWLTSSGQAIDGRTTIDSAINTLQTLNERNAYQANKIGELTQQLAQLDADNAALIRRNKDLADELKRARLDAALTAFERDPDSVLFGPVGEAAENLVRSAAISATITDHPNGTAVSIQPAHAQSAISNQQSPINNSLWSDPNILTTLDDEATDWWIGVAAGRHTWRTVPKPVQLRMVRHVLSFGPETGAMKMTDFDAIKPDWMPSANSHTKTLGLSWQQLNDWSIEL